MKNIVLFDTPERLRAMLPLTFTRPTAMCRCGILTIAEKWSKRLGASVGYLTCGLLTIKYPTPEASDDCLMINGAVLPDADLCAHVAALARGEALSTPDGELVAMRGSSDWLYMRDSEDINIHYTTVGAITLRGPQDIFRNNDAQIRADFELLTESRPSMPMHPSCTLIGDPSQLFIEQGAKMLCATFNVTEGPVYIGADAEVMEGVNVRGSLALCDHAVLKMGAKVYGGTTIGPHCKVGGELGNAVFFGYSNKAHDGYLGNAVIGQWCNLGAGCVSSNLKNDYSKIRLWSYSTCRFERTDMQFCGLIMGDHSKAGIQTMFNTATVVGVGCNIHGSGFPRTFIPSFSYGGAHGMERIRFDKFIETARTVMARRHIDLSAVELNLLKNLYDTLDEYARPIESMD